MPKKISIEIKFMTIFNFSSSSHEITFSYHLFWGLCILNYTLSFPLLNNKSLSLLTLPFDILIGGRGKAIWVEILICQGS